MRVLHVASLIGSNTNGIDYVVEKILFHQNKLDGVQAELINLKDFSTFKALNLIKRNEAVVFHSIFSVKTWGLILYCILKKVPYIIFPHSGLTISSFEKSKFKKKLVMKLFLKKFIHKAASIHFLNTNERDNSYKYYSNSFIVPNGIDVDPNLKEKTREKYIAYLGRYDINHKGIDILLEAITLLRDELKERDCKIIMHGYDPTGISLKFINDFVNEKKLEDLVSVRKSITNSQDKIDFLSNASAYILTSRYEGLPISVLEALSFNTPCLVSKETNMAELIEDNGFGLSCEANPDSVKNMLFKFFIQSEREGFKKSKTFLIENFSWEIISGRLIYEYKKAINYDN